MRGAWAATAAALLVLGGALAGCTRPPAPETAPTGAPTYQLPPRTARPSETPLAGATTGDDSASVTVLGLRAHQTFLVGTHADVQARGEFARLRVAVENDSRTFLSFALADMLLVTADGTAHRPDVQAMAIKRQPETVDLGAQGRIEFDLWYDLPAGSRLRLLRLAGLDPEREIPLPPT